MLSDRISKKLIAENIKALADYYGFKIKDIEDEAGVSHGYLSRLAKHNSTDSNPLIDLLVISSEKFRVSIDSLVSLEFSKLANFGKIRLQCFFEALLNLTNRGHLTWERNQCPDVCKQASSGSFLCRYDSNITFYIFQLESVENELPGYSFFIKNRDSDPVEIARYNLPGPALYDLLRQLFEVSVSTTEFVFIDESADYAIRKFMSDHKLYADHNDELKKYRPLYEFLSQCSQGDVILTLNEIQDILGFALPVSAFKYQSFWANNKDGQHVHCKSWLDAGYTVVDAHKNTIENCVHFKKIKGD